MSFKNSHLEMLIEENSLVASKPKNILHPFTLNSVNCRKIYLLKSPSTGNIFIDTKNLSTERPDSFTPMKNA